MVRLRQGRMDQRVDVKNCTPLYDLLKSSELNISRPEILRYSLDSFFQPKKELQIMS